MDTSDDYIIRPPVTQAEWDAMPRLLMDYKNEFNDETCFTSFEAEMTDLRRAYSTPGSHMIIAVDKSTNEITGCVGMRTLSPGIAEMKRLYVVPAHRGRQLGKKLAVAMMTYAKEKNYSDMVLDTMHEMKAAQMMYQQLGFSVIAPYSDQETRKVICYGKKLSE